MLEHIAIVGTTATGKSEVSIEVAKKLGISEIISLDSMQIYKGMEIGTGVIPVGERHGINHHMISMIEPTTEFTVKDFQQNVYQILDRKSENRFVFVGGTGLYTHAVVDGFSFAPASREIREMIIEEYDLDEENPEDEMVEKAFNKLLELDREAAKKIDPKNVRRIIRALEAIEISGNPFSSSGKGVQEFGEPKINVKIYGLRYSREVLKERISKRVELMFQHGWVEEVEKLGKIWNEMVAPARNAIGYSPIYEWIKRGCEKNELNDLKEHIINKTMQFSRRQRKWFERDPRITWIDRDQLETGDSPARRIIAENRQYKDLQF